MFVLIAGLLAFIVPKIYDQMGTAQAREASACRRSWATSNYKLEVGRYRFAAVAREAACRRGQVERAYAKDSVWKEATLQVHDSGHPGYDLKARADGKGRRQVGRDISN